VTLSCRRINWRDYWNFCCRPIAITTRSQATIEGWLNIQGIVLPANCVMIIRGLLIRDTRCEEFSYCTAAELDGWQWMGEREYIDQGGAKCFIVCLPSTLFALTRDGWGRDTSGWRFLTSFWCFSELAPSSVQQGQQVSKLSQVTQCLSGQSLFALMYCFWLEGWGDCTRPMLIGPAKGLGFDVRMRFWSEMEAAEHDQRSKRNSRTRFVFFIFYSPTETLS
jgi:hypothetical protein